MTQAWLVSQLGTHGRHAGPLGVLANMHDAHMAAFQKDLVLRSVDDAYGYPSPIKDEYLSVNPVTSGGLLQEPVKSSSYNFQNTARRNMHILAADFERYMICQQNHVDRINDRAARGVRGAGRYRMTDIGPVQAI